MIQLYQISGLNSPGAESSKMNESSIKGKRKLSRPCFKSSEEMEMERMIHIEVERNRRKQTNEQLQALRQLMPPSYIPRRDKASIIGGAIKFVKDLEHLLQCLESQKRQKMSHGPHQIPSIVQVTNKNKKNTKLNTHMSKDSTKVAKSQQHFHGLEKEMRANENIMGKSTSSLIDVQVNLIGSDEAIIKILSQRRPREVSKIIAALQEDLHLTIMQTIITTIDQAVFYSFKVKKSTITFC